MVPPPTFKISASAPLTQRMVANTLTIGTSSLTDTARAVAYAVAGALEGAENPTFALVLSTDQYDHEVLAASVNRALGSIPWVGCCTAGVFADRTVLEQGIVIGVFSSREARIGVGVSGPVSVNGHASGRAAAAEALNALPQQTADRHRALIVMPDAVTGNGAEVIRGAASEGGSAIAWAGGGAGDNLRFLRTAQYARGRALNDHVVTLAIDLPRPFGIGIRHGWQPYGPPTMVTKARGATAIELDYESAFDAYRRTVQQRGDCVSLDNFSTFAMTHPLGIPQADGEHVIRDPLSVDADGGLRCVAEVPEGSLVRVMEGDCKALVAAALAAASTARLGVGARVAGAIVFDCVSRWLMLKDRMHEEMDAFRDGLGEGVPILGCLTFGEVGALGGGVPQLHNKTAVVLALPA